MDRLHELLRYGAVAAAALIVDLGCLQWLSMAIHWTLAILVSFLVGSLVSYFLSIRFVFQHHRYSHRGLEGGLFVVCGAAGLAVCYIVVAVLTEIFQIPLLVAKCAASAISFFTGYALRSSWLFRSAQWPPAAAHRSTRSAGTP